MKQRLVILLCFCLINNAFTQKISNSTAAELGKTLTRRTAIITTFGKFGQSELAVYTAPSFWEVVVDFYVAPLLRHSI